VIARCAGPSLSNLLFTIHHMQSWKGKIILDKLPILPIFRLTLNANCIPGIRHFRVKQRGSVFEDSSVPLIGKRLIFSTHCYFNKTIWVLSLCHLSQRSLTHDVRWHSESSKPSTCVYRINAKVDLFLQICQFKPQGYYFIFPLLIQNR
jgi:hypothetical protein